jgi:hypothetical protein
MSDVMAVRILTDGSEETVAGECLGYKDIFYLVGEKEKQKVIGWSIDSKSKKPILLTAKSDCPDHLLRCRNVLRGGPYGLNNHSIISDKYPV